VDRASSRPDINPETGQEEPWGSPQDLLKSDALDEAVALEGRLGPRVAARFRDVATGEVLPIQFVSDRWLRDVSPGITNQTAQQHGKALRYLAEFLSVKEPGVDPVTVLSSVGVEQITRRLAGEFMEWLEQSQRLAPKTIARLHSSLSSMWKWAVLRGQCEGVPWTGLTAGLKRKAERKARTEGRERAYRDDELLRLLRADPSAGRRWSYGAAIFDAMRLSLLTGARQNEICSLRLCDITRGGTGMRVGEAVAKTRSSVREVPLHLLAQRIVQDRLSALPPSGDPQAPLFPELPPGGLDGKRGHRLAVAFPQFREAVLGPSSEVDFHSLRRTFATYWEHAAIEGETVCTEIARKDLLGHSRSADVTAASYVDRSLGWDRYARAVDGVVRSGMPKGIREALEETAGKRPPLPAKVFRPVFTARKRRRVPRPG